jgi:hypothetical protein
MTRMTKRNSTWVLALGVAVVLLGCQETDVIAPDGATISLTANPATIVLAGGIQDENKPVEIIATVSNSIGVPLPGQDVRFTTTAGSLTPAAGTPIETDSFGNATSVLREAQQPPTITAKSGKATATLQLQTSTCALADISLSLSALQLVTCNDTFNLTAIATDTAGDPCVGILINFTMTGSNSATDVTGTFNPGSDTTDQNGEAISTLTITSTTCNSKCVGATCTGFIKASSGSVSSSNVLIVDNVD